MTAPIIIGWLGNVFIVIGLYGIGNRWRPAFIFSVLGELCWIYKAGCMHLWDLLAMCLIFAALAIRSYFKWV